MMTWLCVYIAQGMEMCSTKCRASESTDPEPWHCAANRPLMLQARDHLVEHDALPSSRGILLRREEHEVAVHVIGRLRRRGTPCQIRWQQTLAYYTHFTIGS